MGSVSFPLPPSNEELQKPVAAHKRQLANLFAAAESAESAAILVEQERDEAVNEKEHDEDEQGRACRNCSSDSEYGRTQRARTRVRVHEPARHADVSFWLSLK